VCIAWSDLGILNVEADYISWGSCQTAKVHVLAAQLNTLSAA